MPYVVVRNNKITMKKIVLVCCSLLIVCAEKVSAQHMESVYETVSNIGLGWNLGCVFDGSASVIKGTPGFVVDYENGYDFPPVEEGLFRFAAEKGVTAVRIMVMWGEHVDMETWEIRKDWMDRIQEVVDYIIGNGMYCMLCLNGDLWSDYETDNWLTMESGKYEITSFRFKTIWKQVAERFNSYDSKLIFDAINEPGELLWDDAPEASLHTLNLFNQDFVDVVRSTGGNNLYRNLAVSVYTGQGNNERNFKVFRFPDDYTDEKHIFISHHIYYIDTVTKKLSETSKEKIQSTLSLLDTYFLSKGIPCILGETGLFPLTIGEVPVVDKCEYYEYLLHAAAEMGLSAMAWDDIVDGMDRYYVRLSEPEAFETMLRNSPAAGRTHWNQSGTDFRTR